MHSGFGGCTVLPGQVGHSNLDFPCSSHAGCVVLFLVSAAHSYLIVREDGNTDRLTTLAIEPYMKNMDTTFSKIRREKGGIRSCLLPPVKGSSSEMSPVGFSVGDLNFRPCRASENLGPRFSDRFRSSLGTTLFALSKWPSASRLARLRSWLRLYFLCIRITSTNIHQHRA